MEIYITYLMLFIGILFLLIFNALMDVSTKGKFMYKYWNKTQSADFKNQYLVFNKKLPAKLKNKYTLLLLRTVLVFLTDGWHLLQFLFHSTWQILLTYLLFRLNNDIYPIIIFIFIKTLFSAIFQLIYGKY